MGEAIVVRRGGGTSGGSYENIVTKIFTSPNDWVVPKARGQKFAVRIFGGGGNGNVNAGGGGGYMNNAILELPQGTIIPIRVYNTGGSVSFGSYLVANRGGDAIGDKGGDGGSGGGSYYNRVAASEPHKSAGEGSHGASNRNIPGVDGGRGYQFGGGGGSGGYMKYWNDSNKSWSYYISHSLMPGNGGAGGIWGGGGGGGGGCYMNYPAFSSFLGGKGGIGGQYGASGGRGGSREEGLAVDGNLGINTINKGLEFEGPGLQGYGSKTSNSAQCQYANYIGYCYGGGGGGGGYGGNGGNGLAGDIFNGNRGYEILKIISGRGGGGGGYGADAKGPGGAGYGDSSNGNGGGGYGPDGFGHGGQVIDAYLNKHMPGKQGICIIQYMT